MLGIGILIYDAVDAHHVAAPFDVFATAAALHADRHGGPPLFRCFLLAQTLRPIRARNGLKLLPDGVLMPSADLDGLIIPGGEDAALPCHDAMLDWVRLQAAGSRAIAGIAGGARLLRRAGINAAMEQDMVSLRTAREGTEACLGMVARLAGRDLAAATANQLDYRWHGHA